MQYSDELIVYHFDVPTFAKILKQEEQKRDKWFHDRCEQGVQEMLKKTKLTFKGFRLHRVPKYGTRDEAVKAFKNTIDYKALCDVRYEPSEKMELILYLLKRAIKDEKDVLVTLAMLKELKLTKYKNLAKDVENLVEI